MSPKSKITKYYVGLAVLMLIVIGLFLFTVGQGAKSKADVKTNKALDDISEKLPDYISSNKKIPGSLEEADIKNVPSSISYTKQDSSTYKLCVEYREAANGHDYGNNWGFWLWSLFGGGIPTIDEVEASDSPMHKEEDSTSYLDTYTLMYYHKEGETCRTIKPYINNYDYGYNTPSPSTYGSCSSTSNSLYDIKVVATVDKIEDSNGVGTIYFKTDGQIITDNNKGAALSEASSITSKKYDNISYICKDGEKASASSIKSGQKVTLYMNALTSTFVVKLDF